MATTPIYSDFTLGGDHYLILRFEDEAEREHVRSLIDTAYTLTPEPVPIPEPEKPLDRHDPDMTFQVQIESRIKSEWTDGFVCEVFVTNTLDHTLYNAGLYMTLPKSAVIVDVWSADCQRAEEGGYLVNQGEGKDLEPGETWGFTFKANGTAALPVFPGQTEQPFAPEVAEPEPETEPTPALSMPVSYPANRIVDQGKRGEYLGPIGLSTIATPVDPGGPRLGDADTAQRYPLPEIVPFNVAHPLDRGYTVIYQPELDPMQSPKDNIINGPLGGVYEGGWSYKENVTVEPPDSVFTKPYLRTFMQKGSHAGTKSLRRGAGFDTRTMFKDRAYFAFDVRFKEGFEPAKGGKLPGLAGGDTPSGGKLADKGMSARMMWRQNLMAEAYIYCWNQHFADGEMHNTGRSRGRGCFTFEPGRKHRIEQEVKLNTIDPDGTIHADGWMRVWIDGLPMFEQREIVWRIDPAVQIEGMMHTIFFGGSSSGWEALRDEHVDTGNFVIAA